eukprot:NODE_64_length_24072_cov_0.332541.p4 type:complete len:731 gc:universal NODE_64_length_24072_cov_0.332541:2283-4475(+)
MLSTFTFNLEYLKSNAFVRYFIEENHGNISSNGWLLVDKDKSSIDVNDQFRSRYLNIQFLADAAHLKRIFNVERYLVFDPLESHDTLQDVCFSEPLEFNFEDIVNKKIYLSSGIGSKLAGIDKFSSILRQGGANVFTSVSDLKQLSDMDYCIFNTISSEEFIYAYEHNITIGNTYWLMTLLSHGFRKPTSMQFWMPFPHKDANFSNLVISITNIEGKAREYIQKIVKLLGAQFTGQLSKNCTHLICGQLQGNKYNKALQWGNIQLVNSLWIEDCFTNWDYLDPNLTAYQHISKVIKPNEKLGITSCNLKVIKESLELEKSRLSRSLKSQNKSFDKSVNNENINSDLIPGKPNSHELPEATLLGSSYSVPKKATPVEDNQKSGICRDEPTGENKPLPGKHSEQKIDHPGITAQSITNALEDTSNYFNTCEKPERIKIKDKFTTNQDFKAKLNIKSTQLFLEKPNSQTPTSSKILEKDILDFNKTLEILSPEGLRSVLGESMAHSSVIAEVDVYDDKQNSKPEPIIPIERKRTASQNSMSKKKRSTSNKSVYLMFTKGEATKSQSKTISSLGFSKCKDFKQCTHLIADSVKTTEKFLCAVGKGKQIVTPLWISASGKINDVEDCDNYRPKSNVFKDLCLSQSISRALEQPLFEKTKFVISKSKNLPPADALTNMITSSGGKVVKMIKANEILNSVYVCADEKESVAIKEQYNGIKVLTKEELFRCILFQELQ